MPEAVPPRRPRHQLADEVAELLRERIMTGRLREGRHLHLERLAEEIGVSVTPVREALLALRGEGFVELEPRRGFTVLPLHKDDLADANELHAALAGELAARSATRIGVDRLVVLESVQAELEHATRFGIGDAPGLDRRFHAAIYEVADSAKLTWFLRLASRYLPTGFAAGSGPPELTGQQHRDILHALHNRDADRARRAMHEHLAHTGRLLIANLEQQGRWPE